MLPAYGGKSQKINRSFAMVWCLPRKVAILVFHAIKIFLDHRN